MGLGVLCQAASVDKEEGAWRVSDAGQKGNTKRPGGENTPADAGDDLNCLVHPQRLGASP